MFNISNAQKLGISEVSIVQFMIDGVGKLIQVEKAIISGIDIGRIESIYELEDQKEVVSVLVMNIEGEIPCLGKEMNLGQGESDLVLGADKNSE